MLPDTSVGETSTNDSSIPLDSGACDGGMVTVTSVSPKFGWTGTTVPISITGTGFVQTPTAYLRQGMVLTPLSSVSFVSSTSITARVPKGTAVGAYDVVVQDPNSCFGAGGAFNVTANPPPTILTVSPATGTTQADTDVVVTGCNFESTSTLSTVDSTLAVTAQKTTTSTAGAADMRCGGGKLWTLTGTIQDKTLVMPVGAYLVRVTNTSDSSYDNWASFIITDPSGKLGSWSASSSLNTGRRSLGLVNGRVDNANRFLYAIGGEDSTGTALSSVEVGPLDLFGATGKWFTQRYGLNAPRSGLAVIQQGAYLYAIGGTSSKGGTGGAAPTGVPLDTIERARILDPAQAPVFNAPTTSNVGTLAAGTWYYRVAAVMANNDADNPGGETLASDEIVAGLAKPGQIGLSWSAVMGSQYYRVYRSTGSVSDGGYGGSGSEVLLKDNVMATSYADDGSAMLGTQVPLALGSTGVWVTQGTKLSTPRLNTSAVVAPESATTPTLHVYLLGGWGKCVGALANSVMNCYEYATLSSDGSAITGSFTQDLINKFISPRMRHGSSALTATNGPTLISDGGAKNNASFVLISGGYNVSSIGNTVESSLVQAGGALGAFSVPGKGYALQRDGSQMMIANGYAYAFLGGTMGSYSASSDLSTNASVTPTAVTFGNWSNATNLGSNVGRHGVALESAYFYVAGGTTNDTDALTSVYQVIY